MIQDLRPFMSKHDLESGTRWGQQLAAQLETSHFGLFCLTPTNLNSPWLLFEAGALTKMAQGKACGILFGDVSPGDVTGPLSQFQHRAFDYEGIRELFTDLNNSSSSSLGESQLRTVFEKFWPDLEQECMQIASQTPADNGDAPPREVADVLNDLVVAVRDMERSLASMAALRDSTEIIGIVHQALAHLDNEHLRPLWSLVTVTGERSAHEYKDLVEEEKNSPEVIDNLIDLGILRKTKRDGKDVVEITHDSIATAAISYFPRLMQEEAEAERKNVLQSILPAPVAGAWGVKRIAIYPACSRGRCVGCPMTRPREQAG